MKDLVRPLLYAGPGTYQEEVYSVIGPGVGVDDPVNPATARNTKNNENN